MVKRDLVGRVSTTMAVSLLVLKQIMQAHCGVMLRVGDELIACEVRGSEFYPSICDEYAINLTHKQCRIYRSTVLQIRAMIGC